MPDFNVGGGKEAAHAAHVQNYFLAVAHGEMLKSFPCAKAGVFNIAAILVRRACEGLQQFIEEKLVFSGQGLGSHGGTVGAGAQGVKRPPVVFYAPDHFRRSKRWSKHPFNFNP